MKFILVLLFLTVSLTPFAAAAGETRRFTSVGEIRKWAAKESFGGAEVNIVRLLRVFIVAG